MRWEEEGDGANEERESVGRVCTRWTGLRAISWLGLGKLLDLCQCRHWH